jgi:hypothetical protein
MTPMGKAAPMRLRGFHATDTKGAVMVLNFRVLEKVAFSAVALSAFACLAFIIRQKFPGILDVLPRGQDATISEFTLACLFPGDCQQLLEFLKMADDRSAAALVSERQE